MSDNPNILATVTDEEIAEVKALSDRLDAIEGRVLNLLNPAFNPMSDPAYVETSNAIYDWFEAMAKKYGFSNELECHVDFDSKTICEGLSKEG